MAKPSWSTVNPTSGSGNGTVNVSGTKNTGRNSRSGTLTYKATGVTDIEQAVTQEGTAEYVTINNISAPKEGGNVTITGKSNSSKLNFTLGTGNITVTIPSTYTAGGSSVNNNTAIPGDPGATAEYTFSIVIAVPANATTAAKTRAIVVTAVGGQTATSTISQPAGDPTLSVTPASITLDANGTAVTVTVTSNTNWTVS